MRLRHDRHQVTDDEEEALERAIRQLDAGTEDAPPPHGFWARQLVDINRRIDDATSGVALSLSWAARVAIPGVVAVLAFLIGLKYYAPDRTVSESLRQATAALPAATIDSLYVASVADRDTATMTDLDRNLLAVTDASAEEYYLEHAQTSALVEDLSDQELHEVLATLSTVEH